MSTASYLILINHITCFHPWKLQMFCNKLCPKSTDRWNVYSRKPRSMFKISMYWAGLHNPWSLPRITNLSLLPLQEGSLSLLQWEWDDSQLPLENRMFSQLPELALSLFQCPFPVIQPPGTSLRKQMWCIDCNKNANYEVLESKAHCPLDSSIAA